MAVTRQEDERHVCSFTEGLCSVGYFYNVDSLPERVVSLVPPQRVPRILKRRRKLESESQKHLPVTPSEIEGPFYPLQAQKDVDFDLTQIAGRSDVAQGTQVYIEGRVLDQHGQPVSDATVDLWQANHHGRYRHPHESNTAPLDPAFQGWAIVPSGAEGGFRFKTIIPGSYQVSAAWSRPPHIHFKVTKRGFAELTTQMYFPGESLNKRDRLLLRHPEEQQPLMIASL